MRKLVVLTTILAAAILAMALAGCASSSSSSASASSASTSAASASASAASASASDASASASAAAASSSASAASGEASSAASAGMANPWTEAASADEAAKGAGLDSFDVPEALPVGDTQWMAPTFTYMNDIAQAHWDAGAADAYARKSKNLSGRELSGDYNSYGFEAITEITIDGTKVDVTVSGPDDDVANLMEWSFGGYSYVVGCRGLGGENYGIHYDDYEKVVTSIR